MMNDNMMAGCGGPSCLKPGDKSNRGCLTGVHCDPADNGYNMHASYARKDQKKGYDAGDHTVHNNRQDMLDHLDDLLAAHEKAEGEKPERKKVKA